MPQNARGAAVPEITRGLRRLCLECLSRPSQNGRVVEAMIDLVCLSCDVPRLRLWIWLQQRFAVVLAGDILGSCKLPLRSFRDCRCFLNEEFMLFKVMREALVLSL